MSGCRIGKVRMKSGGAPIHPLPIPEKDDTQNGIIRAAIRIASKYEPDEMGGYVVAAWGKDGTQSCGYMFKQGGPFGPTMAPEIVADILRRRMIESGDWF